MLFPIEEARCLACYNFLMSGILFSRLDVLIFRALARLAEWLCLSGFGVSMMFPIFSTLAILQFVARSYEVTTLVPNSTAMSLTVIRGHMSIGRCSMVREQPLRHR